jgi:hypothetical protein
MQGEVKIYKIFLIVRQLFEKSYSKQVEEAEELKKKEKEE